MRAMGFQHRVAERLERRVFPDDHSRTHLPFALLAVACVALFDPAADGSTPVRAIALFAGIILVSDVARGQSSSSRGTWAGLASLTLLSYLDPWSAFLPLCAVAALPFSAGSLKNRFRRCALLLSIFVPCAIVSMAPGAGRLTGVPTPLSTESMVFPAAWIGESLPLPNGDDPAMRLRERGIHQSVKIETKDTLTNNIAYIQFVAWHEAKAREIVTGAVTRNGRRGSAQAALKWYSGHLREYARFAWYGFLSLLNGAYGGSIFPLLLAIALFSALAGAGPASATGSRATVAAVSYLFERALAAALGFPSPSLQASSMWAVSPFLASGLLAAWSSAFRSGDRAADRTGPPVRSAYAAIPVVILALAWLTRFAWNAPAVSLFDSLSYQNGDAIRTCGYPLLLRTLNALFPDVWRHALTFLQASLLLVASWFFTHEFGSLFRADASRRIAVFAVLSLAGMPFAPIVMTESLALSAVLCFHALVARALRLRSAAALTCACALPAFAALLRPQLIYLQPVAFALAVACLHRRRGRILRLGPMVAFLVALTLAPALDRQDRASRHGVAQRIPFTGIQLIMAPLFTHPTHEEPHGCAEADPRLHGLLRILDEKGLNLETALRDRPGLPAHLQYLALYPVICMVNLVPHYLGIDPSRLDLPPDTRPLERNGRINFASIQGLNDLKNATELDRTLIRTSLRLVLCSPLPVLDLLRQNLFGGAQGLFQIAALVLLAVFIRRARSTGPDPLRDQAASLAILLCAHLLNVALVLLVEPPFHRYMIYGSLPLSCSFIFLIPAASLTRHPSCAASSVA